jgi:hypothetical protein
MTIREMSTLCLYMYLVLVSILWPYTKENFIELDDQNNQIYCFFPLVHEGTLSSKKGDKPLINISCVRFYHNSLQLLFTSYISKSSTKGNNSWVTRSLRILLELKWNIFVWCKTIFKQTMTILQLIRNLSQTMAKLNIILFFD